MRRALAIVLVLVATSLGVVSVSVTDGDAQGDFRSEPLIPGVVREIRAAGMNGVPSDAVAVTLNVTVARPAGDGYLTVFPCGEAVPTASNLNFRGHDDAVPNAVMVRVGTDGKICVVSSAFTSMVVDVAGYVPAGSTLTPLPAPRRLLDTREGLGAPVGPSGPGVLVLQVAGREGIAATARAAVLNVTVVGPAGPGYATVFPCDQPRPEASNVNFVAGDIRPNLVLAGLDPQGRTCIFTTQPTHLVVDATASAGAGAGLRLVTNPERVLDTRSGLGAPAGPVALGESVTVQIAGRAGVPPGATSVVLNVTTTGSTRAGFVTAYPCGDLPNSSNLNHAVGQTIANLVVGRLDDLGRICLFTNVGSHLVADVAGWFEGTNAHQVLTPRRLYDSRSVVDPGRLPAPLPLPPGPVPTVSPITFPPVTFSPGLLPTTTTSTISPSTTSTTTSTTTTTLPPYVPIDTDAPCDFLVHPPRHGSIALRDLLTGDDYIWEHSSFVGSTEPIITSDCSGILVAGYAAESLSEVVVRYYLFDGEVYEFDWTMEGDPVRTRLTELDDGRVLASNGAYTWDVISGEMLPLPDSQAFLQPGGIARDGSVALFSTGFWDDHEVYAFAPATGELIRQTTLPPHLYRVALSPDGTLIAVGTNPLGQPGNVFRTTPTIRRLDGTLVGSYPLGEGGEPLTMRWVSDEQVLVCAYGAPPRLWTIEGDVIDLGVPWDDGCPTLG